MDPWLISIGFVVLILVALVWYRHLRPKKEQQPEEMDEAMYQELRHYTGHPPGAFGKYVWRIIHLAAINFPEKDATEDDIKAFQTLIDGLALTLPCQMCREHFKQMLASDFKLESKHYENRDTLFAWSVKLHNTVNSRTGKTYPTDIEAWHKHYTMLRANPDL